MIHQPTLWEPPKAPLSPTPTRTKGLTYEEAMSALESGHKVRRPNWAAGAHLLWEDGEPKLIMANGERSRRPYSPTGFDRHARNWEIVQEEVAA